MADPRSSNPNEITQQISAPCLSGAKRVASSLTTSQFSMLSQRQLHPKIFWAFSIPQKFFSLPSFSYCSLSSLGPPFPILHLVIISVHTGIVSLENESLLKFCILLILYMFWESLLRAEILKEMWKELEKKTILLGKRPPCYDSPKFHNSYSENVWSQASKSHITWRF